MSRPENLDGTWRDGLGEKVCGKIEEAVEQLAADENYEVNGCRLAETVGHLAAIEQHAIALVELVGRLSPVGKAAMFEAGIHRGVDTGRYELGSIAPRLAEIANSAGAGADRLVNMHSPILEDGQGTGSAMGRDSDLRALRADHDRTTNLPPFRSPKDKFAVAVVKALIGAGFESEARGSAKALERILDSIWKAFRSGNPPNWTKVVKARGQIAEWVAADRKIKALWRSVVEKRNAALRNQGSCPPEESASYVVAPDHRGDRNVDVESEGRGESPRAQRKHPQQMADAGPRPEVLQAGPVGLLPRRGLGRVAR